jgi:8-oxo-dGTP pyrophosphatase MutT (NUDIX family)
MEIGPDLLSEDDLAKLFSERERTTICDDRFKPSAVALPMFVKEEEYHLLFTRRTYKVRHHKGQICFPGGSFHSLEDTDLMATALRETEEEVGIQRDDMRILGALDDIRTHSSAFIITPLVCMFPYPYEFNVNPDEIEDLIEVPLAVLLDERNYREELWVIEGQPYHATLYRHGDEIIWGATARILKHYLALLRAIIPDEEMLRGEPI